MRIMGNYRGEAPKAPQYHRDQDLQYEGPPMKCVDWLLGDFLSEQLTVEGDGEGLLIKCPAAYTNSVAADFLVVVDSETTKEEIELLTLLLTRFLRSICRSATNEQIDAIYYDAVYAWMAAKGWHHFGVADSGEHNLSALFHHYDMDPRRPTGTRRLWNAAVTAYHQQQTLADALAMVA